jgi:hypothetical protein
MVIDSEIDIEILTPDKYYEENEDIPEFGTVRVYNSEVGQFGPGYSKETIEAEKWLETL